MSDDHRIAERVSVNLSVASAAALAAAAKLTGDTRTEVINKALQLYESVRSLQAQGGGAWMQDDADTEPVKVVFS